MNVFDQIYLANVVEPGDVDGGNRPNPSQDRLCGVNGILKSHTQSILLYRRAWERGRPQTTERTTALFYTLRFFYLQLIFGENLYPESFLIFMASFQEHSIYEKKTTHINRTHTNHSTLYI